jgi:hypothetical protein
VPRRFLTAGVLALVLAAPAQGQSFRTLLMPGVSYSRQVDFTPHGPVVTHVINAPRPTGLYALRPVLSNNAIVGRERVTSMQRTVSPTATVAGVNGDLFTWADGHPTGIVLRGGILDNPPSAERSSIGITADGALRVDRISYAGFWKGTGQRRPLRLNQVPGANGVSLFTAAWGPATPSGAATLEAVLTPFPPTAPNADLTGVVTQIGPASGTRLAPGTAVIQARGSGAARLAAEAPVGTTVTVRLALNPDWTGIADAIGGGPLIVRDGKPVFRANEFFSSQQLGPRNPRTGVGQLANGRIVLVAVDGRQPGYSVGMSNFELALALVRLGAVTASALDAGGSTTMAFEGSLLNRPSDPGGERAVAEALLVFYYGVYAPPPLEPVVSPNGDGVAERQGLEYKLVRPANVTATLVGPDGAARMLDQASRAPGRYRFTWTGARPDGSPEPEGRWRFNVTVVDDQGQSSTTDRLFSLNNTIGSLAVAPATVTVRRRGSNLRATFALARPAVVRVTVERPVGAVVATVLRRRFEAGPVTVAWNGRDASRSLVVRGPYVLRVRATNELGDVDLAAPFTVRRR